jgi:cytochrome P450
MHIEKAIFRAATPEECAEARGGAFYQMISFPASCTQKTLGTLQLMRNPSSYFLGEKLFVTKIWDSVKNLFWDNEPFIQRSPSFQMSITHFSDPIILKEFFRHHRSDPDSIFAPSKSMLGILNFMKECFPEMNIFIFNCTEQQTIIFHKLLQQVLSQENVNSNLDKMEQICQSLLMRFKENRLSGESLNLSELVFNYFSEIFGTLIIKNCETGKALSRQLSLFKQLAVKIIRNILTEEDKEQVVKLVRDIQQTTSLILKENPTLFRDEENSLNEDDRKALIFVCLFAAQDNTTTLLTTALWFLAKDEDKQKELQENLKDFDNNDSPTKFPEKLETFFAEILKEKSPVPSVGRIASQDICLEYKMENEEKERKAIFFKGELLGARIDRTAKTCQIKERKAVETYSQFMAFGSGMNKCAGRMFAKTSIKIFLRHILSHYHLKLDRPSELKTEIAITTILTENVHAYLNPI